MSVQNGSSSPFPTEPEPAAADGGDTHREWKIVKTEDNLTISEGELRLISLNFEEMEGDCNKYWGGDQIEFVMFE